MFAQHTCNVHDPYTRSIPPWQPSPPEATTCGTRSTLGVHVLPLIDCANHADTEELANVELLVKMLESEAGRTPLMACLVAKRDVAEGEELLLDYGQRSNDRLFTTYGFTVDANPRDAALLHIPLDDLSDPMLRFLHQCGINPACDQEQQMEALWSGRTLRDVPYSYQARVSMDMDPSLLLWGWAVREGPDSKRDPLSVNLNPLSSQLDTSDLQSAVEGLQSLLTSALERYATGVAEDAALMEQLQSSDIMQHVVRLRLVEKLCLVNVLRGLEAYRV